MHSVHSGSVAVGGPQTNSSSLQGGLLSAKATPEPNTYRSNLRNRGSYELGPIRLTTYTRDYVYQRLGVAFMFIPINTLAYLDVPPGKNNQISSMINLFRNLGASVGISMVATLTQRRAQLHQDTFSMHLSTYNPALRSQLSGLTNNFFHAGMSTADASHQALGRLYLTVQTQASTEAYLDTLKILAISTRSMLATP